MTRSRVDGLCLLALGAAMFVTLGFAAEHLMGRGSLEDFKAVYYDAKCLAQHHDPYIASEVLRVYESEHGVDSSDPVFGGQSQVLTLGVYPPTALLIVLPFTLLGWELGHLVWMSLIAACFIVAAYLAWTFGANDAPLMSGSKCGFRP